MANPFIATPALGDAATFSDPTSDISTPTNLQTQQLGEVWGGSTSPTVRIDLLSAKNPILIALLGHNGSSTGTWQIRGASSAAALTSSPGYDQTFDLFPSGKPTESWDGLPSLRFDSAGLGSFQHWQIDVTDASAPDSAFFAGRLYICTSAECWQPTFNTDIGSGISFSDPTTVAEAIGGQLWPGEQRGVRRALTFTFGFLSQNEMYRNAFELKRVRGRALDVLACLDPTQGEHLHRETVYGIQTELPEIVLPQLDVYRTAFRIEELIP